MNSVLKYFGGAVLLAVAAPAAAVGNQEIIDFDALTIGTTSFYNNQSIGQTIGGGTVVAGTLSNPALSPQQVYGGTLITGIVGTGSVQDQIDLSWPAIGGYVTGTGTITLSVWEYDPNTQVDVLFGMVSVVGGPANFFLQVGSDFAPIYATRWEFKSDAYFTLDDLTLGLVDVGPGVPEPASWALMIAGFGMVGGALRQRRPRRTVVA